MSAVRSETKAFAARSQPAAMVGAAIDPKDDIFLDHWLPRAKAFIDANWNGVGVKPSTIMALRYCQLMTSGGAGYAEARRLFRIWRHTSRQRYRDGFFANPMGEPVKRP